MEQQQPKLGRYDFEKAIKGGLSKSQIINSLRNNYDTEGVDWEKLNADLKDLSKTQRDNITFDILYNNQDSWGIKGLKIKEPPKALQNRILDNNQIQSIEQEVQNMPQWAIQNAMLPQLAREAVGINGFWNLFKSKETIAQDNALKNAYDTQIDKKLEKGEKLSIGEMMRYYQANDGMQGYFSPEAHYQKQQELKKIAQTDFQNLEESQKQELKRQYRITRLWNSERELHEKLKDEQSKKETDAHTKARAKRLESDIINLERTYKNILKSGVDWWNDSSEQSDRYKEMIQENALSLGFDGIGFRGDRIYAYKGDKAIFIDDGFFHNLGQILSTNAFDIGGSITGAIAGAKRGKGKIGTLAGAVAGSAVGAGLGGIADSIIAQFNARGEVNLADALLTGAESATFDIAGGLIVNSGVKAAKGAVKGVQKLMELNPFPFASTLKNFVGGENIQAAKELLEKTFTQEQKDDILEFSKSFGGNLELEGRDTFLTKGAEYLTAKYGADSTIAKVANSLENYSKAYNKGRAREELLTLIRADEKGQSLGVLLEVAKNSIEANKNLREILNATSYKLRKEIENLGLKENAFKDVFNDLINGTKEDYDEAFNKILGNLYENEKVVLNGEAYAKKREEMGELIQLDPQGLGFLNFVEKGIYNPNGVNFEQLHNARKLLNSYHKEASNPSTKDFIRDVADSLIREDIEKGIKEIFLSHPQQYENAKRLYETALSDYANMSETLKILHELKFNDKAKTNAELMDSLIKYIQGDGGLKELDNYVTLTKGLKKEQIESLELNALNRIYEKNLIKDSRDSTFEIFNSQKFLKETEKLSEIFQSESAKKFLEIMQGFNRLFGNDAKIAFELGLGNPPKEGSAIAQSVEGAIKQKIVKGIFSILMRNLPTSNKMIDKLGFKEVVQKMALSYHIEQALKSAYSINDFNFALKKISDNPNTPTPTRLAIESFNKELTKLLEEVRENAEFSKNTKELEEALGKANLQEPQADFGTNYPQFYHKGSEAIAHLLETKSGQVQGAFYRKDLQELSGNGEIDLVWGEITDKTNHKGFGLSHIIDKHPEITSDILNDIIQNGELKIRKNEAIQIAKDNYKVILKSNWKGEPTKNKWIVTAYEEEKGLSISSKPLTETDSLASNSSAIIPQPKSLQEKIQVLKAKRKQELEKAKQEKRAKEAQISQKLKEAQLEKQRQKDAQVGKAINEMDLSLQGTIQARALKPTKINLENKSYPAKFVIIKKEDLKPNFETKGTQGRTQKQENIIKDIQENLNPNKLFFSEGGFEGLPIILKDGQVSVGNHRAEALKSLSKESQLAYKQSAKEVFGVDLKEDELIVRMLDEGIPNEEILNLSFASNVGREQNLSEKALSTLGKYQENLDKLPQNIYAQNVEEMQQIVAKSLDKTNNGLNTFDANFALFASLAKSKNKNILDALNAISGDAEQKAKVVKMFAENAGNFHNLAKQTQMPNLDLRDYLTQALYFTAKADKSRVENFKELAQEIKSILQTTDTQGKNALIQEESHYNELIGKALGYSFARFRELENPSGSFFDFLSNIKQALSEELEPTLFSTGRPLSSADIYDFLNVSIKSGFPSNETSEVLELLPQLKAKHEAISARGQAIPQEVKNIIDSSPQKGRDMQIIGQENFTPEVVKYVQKENKKVAIEKLREEEAEALGFKYPQDVRVTIDSSAINHTLKRHGTESNLAQKSGQEIVKYSDIARYREYAKGADETLKSVDNGGSNVLVSYKQVNGHFVVVEQIKKKNNELGFKTLFKGAGNYKDSISYKNTKAKAQTLSIGYEPSANSFASAKSLNSSDIIPQTTKEAIDPADRFAEPFSNELFNALPKEIQKQYQSLQKQAGLLNHKYHQAKGIKAKRVYEKQYNAMLDKIYDFEQKYPVRVPSTQMQVRGNTLPSCNPDEIIDVEIIQAEPSIQKQITYKRHNLRAKAIQSLQIKLEALKPYPQKQIEYKRLESQINALVEKQHKDKEIIPQERRLDNNSNTHDSKLNHSSNSNADTLYPLSGSHSQERGGVEFLPGTREAFIYHTQAPQGIATLRKELKAALSPYLNVEIINKQTGLKGVITSKEVNKISSKKAVDKSLANGFSRDEHFKASQHLKNLFENATFKDTHSDYKQNLNIKAVHRFQTELKMNEKQAIAKITLFEKIEGKNRIYTLELESLANPIPLSASVHNTESALKAQSVATAHNGATPIAKSDNAIIPQSAKDSTPFIKELQNGDKFFKDDLGKTHKLTKEVQEQWLATFELKSLEESVRLETPRELHEILGKEIKLNLGSLLKLTSQNRTPFIKEIKEVIINPEFALKDNNIVILGRHLKDKDYFVNVSVDKGEYFVSISNGIKEANNIKNKLKRGAEVIYQSPNANSNLQTLLQASRYSTNKIDNRIIPQSKALIKKKELLEKYKNQLEKLRVTIQKLPALPPNRSNNASRALQRNLSSKYNNLEYKIDQLQREIILKDPNSSGKDKLIAEHGEDYVYGMLSYETERFTKNILLDKVLIDKGQGFEINRLRDFNTKYYDLHPIEDFGTNYAEFYHDGKGAIAKLLLESQDFAKSGKEGTFSGQVAGAFWRKDLGDITLVWGQEGTGKSDGFGLSKIAKYHPEVLENLSELIQTLPIKKETPNRYQLENDNYKIAIRKDFEGNKESWVLTAFEKDESIARRRTDLPSSQGEVKKTTLTDTPTDIIPKMPLNQKDEKEFLKLKPAQREQIAQEQFIGNSEQLIKEKKAQELQTLKQKLQNADIQAKREILLQHLQKDSKEITNELMETIRIVKEKDFLPHEIEEAKNLILINRTDKISPEKLNELAINHLIKEVKEKYNNLLSTKKQIAKEIIHLEYFSSTRNISFLERLAKIEKRVLKSLDENIKENNLTYFVATTEGEARARELFESCKPDSEQRELFERILPIAQKLNVEIKQAINDKKLSKEADGVYYTGLNSVRVKNNRVSQEKGKVFLHELIHSVTSRAMIAYETGKKELLTPNQVAAIRNIKEIYSDTLKNHKDLGFELELKTKAGDYGLVSSHEFVAELSNPAFREKLKKVGVFEKIVDNILRLFVSAKEAFALKKNNAYDTLKKNLYAIIDNYKEDFTSAYEMAKIKNHPLRSEKSNFDTQIIPQIQKKFNFDTQKARDLAEWHKESPFNQR